MNIGENKLKTNHHKSEGFTLIELLLYIGLSAAMLLAVSVFLSVIIEARVKNQVTAEVEQQGWQIMQVITQSIRNSESINSPSTGSSGSSLSLQFIDAGKNPTIFDLFETTIRIVEGGTAAIDLNSSNVEVSTLNFDNLSRASTPGNVRVWFTVSHINPASRNEYDYTKTFYGSASLR